jgi:hypothetical protein
MDFWPKTLLFAKTQKIVFVNISAFSNPNSMNFFLFCSPNLALQFKKKFIKIGLLDAEIIHETEIKSPKLKYFGLEAQSRN